MKQFIFLLMLVTGLVFTFSACEEDTSEPAMDPPSISVAPSSIEGRAGSTLDVAISWTAPSGVKSITASSGSASAPSASGTSGTTTSTITVAGDETITFTVTDADGRTTTANVAVAEVDNPKATMTVTLDGNEIISGSTENVTTADKAKLIISLAAADGLKSLTVAVDNGESGELEVTIVEGSTAGTAIYTYAPAGMDLIGESVAHTFTVKDMDDDETTFTVTTDIFIGTVAITDIDLTAGGDYTWYKDVDYMCDGLVYLESGGVLTIEPGTVVKFKKVPGHTSDNTSALIITQGARIMAEGSATEPIIFTAELDNGSLTPADHSQWGGLIVLGYAPVYKKGSTVLNVEGIPSSETRGAYGGNNPEDNSGVIKYVSIRYTGIGLAPGDEIQGLTMGGVGSGTTIDYVDIFSSSDDGIEIFGGTVDIKHISVAFATDDSFDFDLGWLGSGQFLFALQGLDDPGHDHAGEWDGASPDDASLFSAPLLVNCTFIGPGSAGTLRDKAILMRENFAGSVYNSILTDFPSKGIEVQDIEGDDDCYDRIQNARANGDGNSYQIMLVKNTWSMIGDATDIAGIVKQTIIKDNDSNVLFEGETTATIDHLTVNDNDVVSMSVLRGISRSANGTLDPLSSTVNTDVATLSDSRIESAGYRGAFNDTNWLADWSTLSRMGYFAD